MTSRKNRRAARLGPPRRAVALDDRAAGVRASVRVALLTRLSSVDVRACRRRGWRRRAQGRQDSNLQPPVLETGLYQLSYAPRTAGRSGRMLAQRLAQTPDRPRVYGARLAAPTSPRQGRAGVATGALRETMDGMGARVSDRIGGIAESATLAVDAKAKALKAAGRPVIGFGAGEPDFPTPDYIVEAAVAGLPGTRATTATRPAAGLPELRAAVAAKTLRDSGYEVDGRPGAGHQRRQAGRLPGVRDAARPGRRGAAAGAVLDDLPGGDHAGRRRAGRGRRPTRRPATWPPSSSSRRPAPRGPRCCCSARRPTRPARSTRREQVEAIGRWAAEHGLWVVTDEIYEHLVYGDARARLDAGRRCPSWPTRCVVLNGVAKTYAMTGWRVGWMIGPADVVKAATNLQSHLTSNVAQRRAARRRWPRSPAT